MGLERSKVVETALKLLDEVGLDGLSTRRLAQELGVRGPALYWHFENKQALIDAMVRTVLAEAQDATPPIKTWSQRLTCIGRRVRKALLAHRDGARLLAGYRPNETLSELVDQPLDMLADPPVGEGPTENRARLYLAQALRQLVEAGFSQRDALHAFRTVVLFTFGWTMDEQAAQQRRVPPNADVSPDEGFEFGLSAVIAGLEAKLALVKARSLTPAE